MMKRDPDAHLIIAISLDILGGISDFFRITHT